MDFVSPNPQLMSTRHLPCLLLLLVLLVALAPPLDSSAHGASLPASRNGHLLRARDEAEVDSGILSEWLEQQLGATTYSLQFEFSLLLLRVAALLLVLLVEGEDEAKELETLWVLILVFELWLALCCFLSLAFA